MKPSANPSRLLRQAQTALEQSVSSASHEAIHVGQSPFWGRSITWALMGTAAFGIAWLALAKTEEIVVAPGKLQPIGSVKEIQMPVGGIAEAILVKEGDRVKAGQVVMRLETESSEQNMRSLLQARRQKQQQLLRKQEQLALKQQELKRYLQMNSEQTEILTRNLKLEQQILGRLEALAREGASAELQYLQQRNKVQEVDGQLMQNRSDRLRQTAIHEQASEQLRAEISALKAELADLESRLTEARVTLRYQAIRSPVDGIVFDLKPKSPGYAAQGTEAIMKIVPLNAMEAKVEIASSNIGFVQTGMPVDISIDSFPATDFGVLKGKVRQIGSDALPPDPAKQEMEYRYPAMIQLSSQ